MREKEDPLGTLDGMEKLAPVVEKMEGVLDVLSGVLFSFLRFTREKSAFFFFPWRLMASRNDQQFVLIHRRVGIENGIVKNLGERNARDY